MRDCAPFRLLPLADLRAVVVARVGPVFVCIGSWCLACVVRDLSCAVFLFMKSVSLYIWLGCTRGRCQIFDLFRLPCGAGELQIRLYILQHGHGPTDTDNLSPSASRAICSIHSRPRPAPLRLAPARVASLASSGSLSLSLSLHLRLFTRLLFTVAVQHTILVSHAERSR